MATFEYVEVPPDAIRLKSSSLEPAEKVFTSLPDATPTSVASRRAASEPLSPTKSALALVPQMLLSTSIPTTASPTNSIIASAIATPNPRTPSHALLSARDPLSVPIMTANFRRFVSKVGPIFWLQDRIEEVILWKKGWKRTTVWLAVYSFFCYFPRLALLIPHILLLSVMLCYYPDPGARPVPISVGEGTADWQANIQAIQNLMGAFSDVHDTIVPLLPFLVAPPTPPLLASAPKSQSRFSSMSSSTLAPSYEPTPHAIPQPSRHTSDSSNLPVTQLAAQPHHPFLIFTLLTFLLLLPILMADLLPLRFLFFLAGVGGVGALHPRTRDLFSVISSALSGLSPGLSFQFSIRVPRLPNLLSLLPTAVQLGHHSAPSPSSPLCSSPNIYALNLMLTPRDAYLFFRQLIDNDKLEDTVWRAPLAHVELWENERWVQDAAEGKWRKSVFVREGEDEGGEDDAASTTSTATTGTVTGLGDGGKGTEIGGTWSKVNLRPSERVAWTRGRDGWSGIGGEVSSNLTFSLSPGWAFVETEGWRPDLNATWAAEGVCSTASVRVGADEDGWTYTTDTWTYPRPDARPCDGWVTRRRRWVRRVYFKGVEQ